ncbi:MAG: hypothetical protein WBE13_13185 [Candidatus Acidiferrum sp.]
MTVKSLFALAFVLFVWNTLPSHAQEIDDENVPSEIGMAMELGPFAQSYSIDGSVNPFYLRGDFDGDGKADYAIRIKSKRGGELGFAIWLSSRKKIVVLGAGIPFKVSGQAATNLKVLNTWQVYPRRPVEQGVASGPPPRLIGEAILAGKRESASGLIYWNGKSFVWYQQGD